MHCPSAVCTNLQGYIEWNLTISVIRNNIHSSSILILRQSQASRLSPKTIRSSNAVYLIFKSTRNSQGESLKDPCLSQQLCDSVVRSQHPGVMNRKYI
jgi:hypothetical protein